MKFCLFIFHEWECYKVFNYTDTSFGNQSACHCLCFICKKCMKNKNVHKYGCGYLNDEEIKIIKELKAK